MLDLNEVFAALIAFLISVVVVFTVRLFVRKEKHDRKRFEMKFIERFGKKHKSKAREIFEKLEKRHFISGHVCLATILAYLIILKYPHRFEFVVVMVVFVLLVGISRLVLKKHDTFDIFMGVFLGMVSIYFVDILLF